MSKSASFRVVIYNLSPLLSYAPGETDDSVFLMDRFVVDSLTVSHVSLDAA